jgi:serpin B
MRRSIILACSLLCFTLGVSSQSTSKLNYNNRFAFDFFRQISKNDKGNIFFSPASISAAMGMTYAGAKSETQGQIAKVFHFPSNNRRFHSNQGNIIKDLSSQSDSIQLNIVNSLWVEKTYSLKKSYRKLIEKSYSAAIHPLDFATKFNESRILINENISNSTNQKIKNLLPEGSVDNLTKLILTNAVYFKADWKLKFQKDKTGDAPFYLTPENTIKCKMMGIKKMISYFEDEKIQAVELAYAGNGFSMLILLPRQSLPLDELILGLSPEYLEAIIKGITKQEVSVSIPKFKLAVGYQLKSFLSEMGMQQPFSNNADFGGMTSSNDLKISDVFHKAFVEVNEEGTEASAATAVVIQMKSIMGNDKFFRANRPFIFLIREKTTGSILFLGRMVDPTKSEQ